MTPNHYYIFHSYSFSPQQRNFATDRVDEEEKEEDGLDFLSEALLKLSDLTETDFVKMLESELQSIN